MELSFLSRRWKYVLVLLCVLALSCATERLERSELRTTEARLSGFDAWRPCAKQLPEDAVLETADCGPINLPRELVSLTPSECDDKMKTSTDAVKLLARVERCTDAAVEKLETLTGPNASAALLSDLSGAYYIRAQRKNQPSDLVRALAVADRAVAHPSSTTEARFNRALAEEELGFTEDAIRSWDSLRKETPSSWTSEAGYHHAKLIAQASRRAATQWSLNKERLPIVAATGDPSAVQALIEPYHDAAQKFAEEEVLPAWAAAVNSGDAEKAQEKLVLAEMVAAALAELEQDRYLMDGVQKIREIRDPKVLAQLVDGHLALQSARASRLQPGAAETLFERAQTAFTAAGSPLRLGAMLGRAAMLVMTHRDDAAAALLRTVEREARGRYPSVLARVHTGRGYPSMLAGLSIEALAEYKKARTIFQTISDRENAGRCQDNIIGLYRQIGHREFTWRAIFQDQRNPAEMVDVQSRHSTYGERALSAVELGYPTIALRYQNIAVRLIEDELSQATEDKLSNLRRNRGIALLNRAGMRIQLHDRAGAQSDLAEAAGLFAEDSREAELRNGFRARIAEIEALELAGSNRKGAIAALSEAIQIGSNTRYRAMVAPFLMERAELHRLDGNRAAMVDDLESVIAALRVQEVAALQSSRATAGELLWSAYFSRAQETYRRLIRHYVEDGAAGKAFDYAERARAYEPLHLIRQREDLPDDFRKLIEDGEPLRLYDVEKVVPAGTTLLLFSVLDDRTYVWIVTNGASEHRMLKVGERQIKEWTRALQRFAALGDDERFQAALIEPYRALFAEPLARITKSHPPARLAKLVIIPDRSMHGLPFAALNDGGRHLIRDFAVTVSGSATLFAFSLAQNRRRSTGERQFVVLFADPGFDASLEFAADLRPLDAARREVSRIAALYSPAADVLPPIMGNRVTVPEFLKRSAESTILHVAAHGIANPDVPPRSFLLLTPSAGDLGVIDAERLLTQLQLNGTRLAVLSACSSAGGTPVGPEGLAPLVRPFIAAGVPGVVGTLWSVTDDTATEDLLVRFHQYYRDGHDADESLRKAQLEMLDAARPTHPVRNWAAFQMIGYASSPFLVSADGSGERND